MKSKNTTFTPLSNMETSAFCSQMSMILKAGISSLEGIAIMMQDSINASDEHALLANIYHTLTETGSLCIALTETGVFPSYMLSMVEIGEQTGCMDDVMESLADYYEKEEKIAQTIKNAITYPFVIVLMMIIVVFILIMKVMPVFNQVYKQVGIEMTGLSKLILNIGNFLNQHLAVFVIFISMAILTAIYLIKTKNGQKKLLALCGSFHVTGMLVDKISAYRFANGMALTLSSGLTPEESLKLSASLVADDKFKRKLNKCMSMVNQGQDLCDSLLKCEIFTGIYTRMATIAGRTGLMDEIMQKIALQMEGEIDESFSQILTSIEPSLVILLSVIVGIILLSVMLPLISIMSAL